MTERFWTELKPVLIITRREIRDQLRDWRIIAPIIVLTLFFPGLMNLTAQGIVGFVTNYGAEVLIERIVPFLLLIVGFFPISISLVIALESFVGEKERMTIEPLLCSPLKDWQLYVGKLAAVMVPPLIASNLGIVVYLIAVFRDVGWEAPDILLIQVLILTFVQTLVMVSGAVVVSTQTTSVRAANLLASFIIIPMALLIQAEAMIMFWGEYDVLWMIILGLLLIAFLLIRMGINHFNREEMLGRNLDILNFKWMWTTFWKRFLADAKNPLDWFRAVVWQQLKKVLPQAVILLIALAAGFWIGFDQANYFDLSEAFLNLDNIQDDLLNNLGEFSLFSPAGVPVIWIHNLRAILLAAFAGLFSFGILGILILMLPFIIIGFVMSLVAQAGFSSGLFFIALVLPHGIFEIPAIIFCGGAILKIGASLAGNSQDISISEGLINALADFMQVFIGFGIPVFLIAAIIEALLTPQIAVWLLAGV